MTADKAANLVPKLRFPEFEGAGDWEKKRLSSLVKLVSGVHLAPGLYSPTGGVPYFTGPSDFTDAIQCVAKWTAESVSIAKQHDTLITVKGSGVGKIWYLTLPSVAMGRQLMAARAKVGDRRFLYQFLSTRRAQFEALASGNLIPGLSRGDILGMVAYFPSRDEQKKIADCLGSLDDLIAAEGVKLEALRRHKQGLLQQLFPQPGETVPRLRFPEFSEDGTWEETAIGNMGEVITGSTPSTSRRDFYGGDFMFVSPADISDLRFVEETKTTLTEAGYAECRPIKKNSVLFVCIGSIGKVAQCSRPCATNQQINSLVASPAFVADFVYYLLDRESLRIARFAGKQTMPIINKSSFAAVKVTAPASAEQQRIADCLSSHDARIASQVRKLNTLKTHKQGLLQQLFPNLETE